MSRKIPIAECVLDFSFFPRAKLDWDMQHVAQMRESMASGHEMPPIIIDKKSRRVVDGFHRLRAHQMLYGENGTIEVVEKSYKNDREMLLDAIQYNVGHGSRLTTHDRIHCMILGETMGIDIETLAGALHFTMEHAQELRQERTGKLRCVVKSGEDTSPQEIPLKRTIKHMGGKTLTKDQAAINKKLGGMPPSFYVNQLILLINGNLIDMSDDGLLQSLGELQECIAGLLVKQ